MLNQQFFELAMWVGVIMMSPLLYRFSYAASALLWRRIFPTRRFEIVYTDEESETCRSVTIVMPKDKSRTLVQLIDEAKRHKVSNDV